MAIASNNFYQCTCGCRVHQAHFDRLVTGERLPESIESEDGPPLPTDRRKAARMAYDMVMGATEIIERLHEAGLISGNPDHLRQKIAELADDTVYDNWNGV